MKRTFECAKCSNEFEIEADHFINGVKGQLVDDKGILHTFVDPTEDHLCDICVDIELGKLVEVSESDDV